MFSPAFGFALLGAASRPTSTTFSRSNFLLFSPHASVGSGSFNLELGNPLLRRGVNYRGILRLEMPTLGGLGWLR